MQQESNCCMPDKSILTLRESISNFRKKFSPTNQTTFCYKNTADLNETNNESVLSSVCHCNLDFSFVEHIDNAKLVFFFVNIYLKVK